MCEAPFLDLGPFVGVWCFLSDPRGIALLLVMGAFGLIFWTAWKP